MAFQLFHVQASTIQDLPMADGFDTQVSDALSLLLNRVILQVQLVTEDEERIANKIYAVLVSHDASTHTLASPYILNTFTGRTLAEASDNAATFRAANPGFFHAPPFQQLIAQIGPNIEPWTVYQFSSADAVNGALNWAAGGSQSGGGGGGSPTGPAGGDLGGTYPSPRVVGLQNKPMPAPTVGGTRAVYDITTNAIIWYSTPTYTTLAAAAAAQVNQIIGEQVTIYNAGAPTSEDGTYVLNAKTGSPANYTKISDAVDQASEVSITDAGGYYSSTNVEGALQEVGSGLAGNLVTVGATAGPNVVGSVVAATYASVVWEITCNRTDVANQRYVETLLVTHDGTSAYDQSQGVAVVPAAAAFISVTSDISAGNLRLLVTFTIGTWNVTVKRLALAPV